MTNPKLIAYFLLAAIGGCRMVAQTSAQLTFPSAGDAAQSLFEAVKKSDLPAIARILGGPTDLASSSDDDRDKIERELFAEKYEQMHRIGRDADGSMTLYLGAENWPLPIPLVQKQGMWRFDPEIGAREILYRRIGDNEFAAISLCHDFVAGRKAGVGAEHGIVLSPARFLLASTSDGQPVPFRGYYFRVLRGTRPDHLTLVAYPAEYRSAGVMTFVVTNKGVVYEKDLGPGSSSLASAMRAFHKDQTWRNVDSKDE